MKNNKRQKRWLVGLLLLLPLLFLGALLSGPALNWADVAPLFRGESLSFQGQIILFQIRLPRILFALLVGAGLSVAGAALQSLLQNPLAEPYTLGISGGAIFGVTLGMGATTMFSLPLQSLPFFGFAGALLATALVYFLSLRGAFSLYELILGGVVISFIFSSLVVVLLIFLPADLSQSSLLLLIGNLSGVDTLLLPWAGGMILLGILALFSMANQLNLLALGDEKAQSLGVNPRRTMGKVFWITSLITGAAVSLVGLIGFVGLVIPHLFRMVSGADLKYLFPLCALGGAMALVLADTLARTLFFPIEIPVGVVTGIGGGFFFLVILAKKQKF